MTSGKAAGHQQIADGPRSAVIFGCVDALGRVHDAAQYTYFGLGSTRLKMLRPKAIPGGAAHHCLASDITHVAGLGAAGMGVAVENAHPYVKEQAAFVAPSNEECAVAAVIRRFFGV